MRSSPVPDPNQEPETPADVDAPEPPPKDPREPDPAEKVAENLGDFA